MKTEETIKNELNYLTKQCFLEQGTYTETTVTFYNGWIKALEWVLEE